MADNKDFFSDATAVEETNNSFFSDANAVEEKKNSAPSVIAPSVSTSESVSGGLGGIEPSMDNLRVRDNYVTPSGKAPETETPQQKSERLNSALTPNARAQKNYIVAKSKYDELISNPSANPIEVDQSAKQVDYFQSRLEKPQTKENDVADEVASVLYSFNKSVSDNIVAPIAGAINLMEDLESGGGIFKKPNRTLSKTVGDISKYYDKVSEQNQPQTIAGKTAAATTSAIPLIALTTMTGAGTLPFVIGGQKALTEYGNEPNKPMSLKAEEATEALGEGIKEGLEIEASMMVGGAFGKAVSQELNLGKWGSATARGVGVGAAFALPDFAKVAVENKSLDAPDKEETFVSFATGLAFEAPKFFGLIKNAVSEKKVEQAAKIQNLDIYNTVFSAPLEAISEAVEIPQSSELVYKRASSFLKKENPTKEDKIAFQTLTRTAGVKDLVDVIISNPEKAKEQISNSDLTPEQKSEFRKRITEINQYFNPIEVKKTELSNTITTLEEVIGNGGGGNNPIEKAENKVLANKAKAELNKAQSELEKIVAKQIDEKIGLHPEITIQQPMEVTAPDKAEGVGDGAGAQKIKINELGEKLIDKITELDLQLRGDNKSSKELTKVMFEGLNIEEEGVLYNTNKEYKKLFDKSEDGTITESESERLKEIYKSENIKKKVQKLGELYQKEKEQGNSTEFTKAIESLLSNKSREKLLGEEVPYEETPTEQTGKIAKSDYATLKEQIAEIEKRRESELEEVAHLVDKKIQKDFQDKINAKYDAEIAALKVNEEPKSTQDEKGNEEAEGEELLTPQPEKKKSFYSYLREQGMGRLNAAINAKLFEFNVRRRAKILGKSIAEVMDEYDFGDTVEGAPGTRGSWSKEKGKRLINIYKKAKSTTAAHEVLGHDYLDTIVEASKGGHAESSVDLDVIAREFVKGNKTKLTEKQIRQALENFDVENLDRVKHADAIKVHEWFAKSAEKYLANPETKGISPRLKRLFDKFITYLADLHNELAGNKISKPMQDIFIKAFGERYKEAEAEIKNTVEVDNIIENSTFSENDFFAQIKETSLDSESKALEDSSFDIEKTRQELINLAHYYMSKGIPQEDIISKIKKGLIDNKFSQKQIDLIHDLIDKNAANMLSASIDLGGKKADRVGVQKILDNPNIPNELKELIKNKKDLMTYEPKSMAEGDMLAESALLAYGMEAVENDLLSRNWESKISKYISNPEYAARLFKAILNAQTNLINKYAAEGNFVAKEAMIDRQLSISDRAAKLSTKVAQTLALYRDVFGHPESMLKAADRRIEVSQKKKIANRDRAIEMLQDGIKKAAGIIDDLMQKSFEVEETKEQLQERVSQLESEQKNRTKSPRELKITNKFENPSEVRQNRAAELKERLKNRRLTDSSTDAELLKDYTQSLFEDSKKGYTFSQFAKIARNEIGELTDAELAEAYKSVRDENKLTIDSDEVIDNLIKEKIVKDEELKAKKEAKENEKRLKEQEKEAREALKAWNDFEAELKAKNKRTEADDRKAKILEEKYLNAEKRRQEKEAKELKNLTDKSYKIKTERVKKEVLQALKDAGFEKNGGVDWQKIAVERVGNPEKAERIIIETVNKVKGLTAQDKINLKEELLNKLDDTIQESKRKVVEKVLKESGVKKNVPKGELDRIAELANAQDGVSEKKLAEAMNKIFKVREISKSDRVRILDLGRQLQTETLKKERTKIINEMTFLATKNEGYRGARVILDMLYANMLSGAVTQAKNATNRFDIWKHVIGNVALSGDKNYLKVLAKSRKRGILYDTLMSGVSVSKSTVGMERYGNKPHVNELEHLSDMPAYIRVGLGGLKYVSRIMDGIDGENWVRAYDQAQYKYLVNRLRDMGYTKQSARAKAMDIMYPISEQKSLKMASDYFLNKNQNVGNSELKRAAYDLMQQSRESKAETLGIKDLDKIGEAFANWLTFKGDAVDGSFELMPTIAAGVKGKYLGMAKAAEGNKFAEATIAMTKFINAPFIDGISRIMERSGESAVLGVGGFAKGAFQANRAKGLLGEERLKAKEQARETYARAMGSLIWQASVFSLGSMISYAWLNAIGEEEDKDKNGLKGSFEFGNKGNENKPHDVWALANGRVNIPIGMMGTDMTSAAIVGNLLHSKDQTALALSMNIVNSVVSQSMFGSESKTFNFLKEVAKTKNTGELSPLVEEYLKRSSAQTVAAFMPYRSFVKQNIDMFTNANVKETKGFVGNLWKYSFGGIGLNDRLDYRGRVVKLGKKYPESAAGVTEMFKQSNFDDWDALIGGLGAMNFNQRSQNEIIRFGQPIDDEDYYEYKANVGAEFNRLLTFGNQMEVKRAKKTERKTKTTVQRDMVNKIYRQARETVEKRMGLKNVWGEDF